MGRFTKILLAILVLVLVGGALYFWNEGRREHLIMGVPYWGIYTGSELSSPQAFAVYTILQYWGDARFSLREIATTFPSEVLDSRSTTTISDFFSKNGYKVESLAHTDPHSLFPYTNKDIPVITTLLLTPTYENRGVGTERVVIGYSVPDKEVIVHDNQFGNNYRISFDDYAHMRVGFGSALVITPTDELLPNLPPLDRNASYPPRTSIMESESIQRITVKWVEAATLTQMLEKGAPVAADLARAWEEILAEPDFERLHPAARFYASFMLARTYTKYLEKHTDAVSLLNKTTLPLTETDFSQPFEEWGRMIPKETYELPLWTSQPWVLLGLAHERNGNLEAAKDAYGRAVEANPSDTDAIARFNGDITVTE